MQVSSVEIERVCTHHVPAVAQAAAIAVPPEGNGPEELHLFVVASDARRMYGESSDLRQQCQQAVRQRLNPLFKVKRVTVCAALPRNASNKVMRRVLRDQLLASRKQQARL